MSSLKNKTVFITGASRGIGKAIGLRLASEGANIVIAAKTIEPHPKLPGTIFTAAEEMDAAGGKGLPICTDIRFEEQVQSAVDKTIETFGGIDVGAVSIHYHDTMYSLHSLHKVCPGNCWRSGIRCNRSRRTYGGRHLH